MRLHVGNSLIINNLSMRRATKASAAKPNLPPPNAQPAAKDSLRRAVTCSPPRFNSLASLLPPQLDSAASKAATAELATTLQQNLRDLVEQDERGRPRLTFALPDATALDNLTNVLARLLAQTQSRSESVAGLLSKRALQSPEKCGKRGTQTVETNEISPLAKTLNQ